MLVNFEHFSISKSPTNQETFANRKRRKREIIDRTGKPSLGGESQDSGEHGNAENANEDNVIREASLIQPVPPLQVLKLILCENSSVDAKDDTYSIVLKRVSESFRTSSGTFLGFKCKQDAIKYFADTFETLTGLRWEDRSQSPQFEKYIFIDTNHEEIVTDDISDRMKTTNGEIREALRSITRPSDSTFPYLYHFGYYSPVAADYHDGILSSNLKHLRSYFKAVEERKCGYTAYRLLLGMGILKRLLKDSLHNGTKDLLAGFYRHLFPRMLTGTFLAPNPAYANDVRRRLHRLMVCHSFCKDPLKLEKSLNWESLKDHQILQIIGLEMILGMCLALCLPVLGSY